MAAPLRTPETTPIGKHPGARRQFLREPGDLAALPDIHCAARLTPKLTES
jgi:hypothetical protein